MSPFFGETHYGFFVVIPSCCSKLKIIIFLDSMLVMVALWLLGFINSLGNAGKKKNISSRQYTFYRMKGSSEESWGENLSWTLSAYIEYM